MRSYRFSGSVAVLVGVAVTAVVGSVLAQAPAPTDPANQLAEMIDFRLAEAKDFFEMGYLDECAREWQALMDLDPSPAKCLAARETLGFELFGRMLEEPKLTKSVAAFLKRANQEVDRLNRDPAYVGTLVADLQRTASERQAAIYKLTRVGERAVPILFARLAGAADERQQLNVKLALEALGEHAVAPLIEALRVRDDELRREVEFLLGKAGDLRALAPLKALLEDADQSAAVRAGARAALEAIFEGAAERSAADYYYELAQLYYYESETVQPGYFEPTVPLWQWDAEKQAIVSLEVSRRDYYLERCKLACYEGLAAAPGDAQLNELLVSVYFVEKREKADEADEELAGRIKLLLASAGKPALLGALRRQLQHDKPELALDVISVLRSVLAGKGLEDADTTIAGNSLIETLDFPDQVLNFCAAEALAEAAPATSFECQERVVPYLAWGVLWGSGVKTALVASADAELRNTFQGHLRALGYEVLGVGGLEEASDVCGGLPTAELVVADADLMVELRPVLGEFPVRYACRVVVTPAEAEVEALEGQAEVSVPRDITEAGLAKVLAQLMPESGAYSELSVAKEEVARMAAAALAKLSRGGTVLDASIAAGALLLVMESEDEAVRLPVLEALGNAREPSALGPVLTMGADSERDEKTRLAALDAARVILGAMAEAPKPTYGMLESLLDDESEAIREAAGRALSAGPFPTEQIVAVLVEKKVTLKPAE